MSFNAVNIPHEMKEKRQWVNYSIEIRDGEETKIPKQPNGRNADSTDPATWSDFETCFQIFENDELFDGVGFVFNHDYTGTDFDACIDRATGEISDPVVAQYVRELNSYTEYSQSGGGLHVINKTTKPGPRCKIGLNNNGGTIEMYDAGRFFAMTGDRFNGATLTVEKDAVNNVYGAAFGATEPTRSPNQVTCAASQMSDGEIIKKAIAAKNGDKFARLFYDGDVSDYGGDDSRADAAMCAMLTFYTQDADQIDRIFRKSALMRPKWDRKTGDSTYGAITIRNALALGGEVYQGNGEVTKEPEQMSNGDIDETRSIASMWYDGDMSSVTIYVSGKPITKRLPEIVPIMIVEGPQTIEELLNVFHTHLHFEEDYSVTGPVCAFLYNFTAQDPGITGIIGPSGSIKTEIIRSFGERQNQFCYPISSITENTLISGMDKNIDTIPILRGRVLTIKDLTTLLSKKEDIRAAIFADFREFTDGYLEKEFGNGVKKGYHDIHSSILFAATPAIERYYSMYAELGTRMLFMRPQNDPIEARIKSRENQKKGIKSVRKTLQDSMTSFVDTSVRRLTVELLPEIPKDIEDDIGQYCDVLAWLRHPLHHDLKGYIDDVIPDPEFPTRLNNAICLLTQMHAFIYKRDVVDRDNDFEFARRIVADNIPVNRAGILTYLTKGWQSTSVLSQNSGINVFSLMRPLDELAVLGLAEKMSREDAPANGLDGRSSHYRLAPEWSLLIESLYSVIRLGGRIRKNIKKETKESDTLSSNHTIQKISQEKISRIIYNEAKSYNGDDKKPRSVFINMLCARIRRNFSELETYPLEDVIDKLSAEPEMQTLLAERTEVGK